MFREMRRKNQQLGASEIDGILTRATSGVLALTGDGGYPYALPISYVYHNESLFFHSAKSGHKLDAVKGNPKASFCVIAEDNVIPEKYTTYYKSVIAFGRVSVLENEAEKRNALLLLAEKYNPNGNRKDMLSEIEKSFGHTAVLEFKIEHITGKKAKEL